MAIVSSVKQDRIILTENGAVVLSIAESVSGDLIEVLLEGNLRNDTKHFFGDELKSLILLKRDLVIDMKGVTYLSSACSEVLLNIQRTIDETEGGSMFLRNVPDAILKDMKESGLSELIMIENPEE